MIHRAPLFAQQLPEAEVCHSHTPLLTRGTVGVEVVTSATPMMQPCDPSRPSNSAALASSALAASAISATPFGGVDTPKSPAILRHWDDAVLQAPSGFLRLQGWFAIAERPLESETYPTVQVILKRVLGEG